MRRSPSAARANESSTPVNTRQLRNDRLGTLVSELCDAYDKANSWEELVESYRGPSYLSASLDDLDHPAVPLLRTWRDQGVPAKTTDGPWTPKQKEQCIQRGCHRSALDHSEFLREEMATFMEDRFWMVLPYDYIKDRPELMIWPAAIKEERDRRPRLLCDHSWDWGWPSINETTIHHAPPEAMQFGGAMPRVLRSTRHSNPKFGPPKLGKLDLKDGFYRLYLEAGDLLRLALLLPPYEGEPQLIGIPMACTMGWVQSPPTFCAMSETICDLANQAIRSAGKSEPHRLETEASIHDDLSKSWQPRPREQDNALADLALAGHLDTTVEPEADETAPPSNCAFQRPLSETDVFVDDFILLGQGGAEKLRNQRRHVLHAVDKVLTKPDVHNRPRHEAVSVKKLRKGDGSWTTRKQVLGWIIDTLELPAHRKQDLSQIFYSLQSAKRVSEKRW